MKRVEVEANGRRYTYETEEVVKVGDKVILPSPDFMVSVQGPTWEGTVTTLQSNYVGPCVKILAVTPCK